MAVKWVTDSMHGALEHLSKKGEVLNIDLEHHGDSIGLTLDVNENIRTWLIHPGGWYEEVE